MHNGSQYGDTLFLKDFLAESSVQKMARLHFQKDGLDGPLYSEVWLQKLIMSHPGLLPIMQIEPAFASIVPVCVELPMRAGYLDNLLMTPAGDIALIECKLWRNPEARRKVVAQIIDYASEMTTWTYETLQNAVTRTKSLDQSDESERNIFEIVAAGGDIDESTFHDSVSRNLKRGRFLLLIVGDGIREGLETLTEFLQQHAGLHFVLSIVELALFEIPSGGYIAQPRVLARTTNIERGIVTLKDGVLNIARPSAAASIASTRGTTITQEHFFERLEKNCPDISQKLAAFINDLANYNVEPEFGSNSMILRWHLDDAKSWNLGMIVTSGDVWMDYHGAQARNSNMLEVSKQYLQRLASLVPGASVKLTQKKTAWNVAGHNGHSLRIDSLLADDSREKGWLQAIAEFQTGVAKSSPVDQ